MGFAVLIVEDEAVLAKNIKIYLERSDFEPMIAPDASAALDAMESFRPDLVLLDFNLPGMDGLALLDEIRKRDAKLPVVMMTGHGSVQVAVDAMRRGASDYLSKPIALAELKLVLERALKMERLEGVVEHFQTRERDAHGIDKLIGESPAMQEVRDTLERILEAEETLIDEEVPAVLITGETGTGKELIARALHYAGRRKSKPFVEINCASIPSNLLEAELFGYERGAFTDARQRKPGLVEAADGGTLFLDEIGEIELGIQVKLLKLLEEKKVRRLGGTREARVNVRIVTATNRDLETMVRDGRFRADLYFRLRILQVASPPLRERGMDVLLLARWFIKLHGERYGKKHLRLSSAAETALVSYTWPGNVRELKNSMEQAVLLTRVDVLDVPAFPFCRPGMRQAIAMSSRDPQDAVAADTPVAAARFPDGGLSLPDVERDLLLQGLAKTGWNITKAAKLLGLSRDTLRYRIEKYKLTPGR